MYQVLLAAKLGLDFPLRPVMNYGLKDNFTD